METVSAGVVDVVGRVVGTVREGMHHLDIPFGSDCALLTTLTGTAAWATVATARRKAASAARLSVPRSVTARVVTVRVAVMADVAASVVAVALHPRLRRLGMRMPGRLRSRLSHPSVTGRSARRSSAADCVRSTFKRELLNCCAEDSSRGSNMNKLANP